MAFDSIGRVKRLLAEQLCHAELGFAEDCRNLAQREAELRLESDPDFQKLVERAATSIVLREMRRSDWYAHVPVPERAQNQALDWAEAMIAAYETADSEAFNRMMAIGRDVLISAREAARQVTLRPDAAKIAEMSEAALANATTIEEARPQVQKAITEAVSAVALHFDRLRQKADATLAPVVDCLLNDPCNLSWKEILARLPEGDQAILQRCLDKSQSTMTTLAAELTALHIINETDVALTSAT